MPVKTMRLARSLSRGLLLPVRLALRAARWGAFLALLWVRGPIVLVCNFLVVPGMAAGFLSAFLQGWTHPLTLISFGGSFLALVLSFSYDSLLLWLGPDELILY